MKFQFCYRGNEIFIIMKFNKYFLSFFTLFLLPTYPNEYISLYGEEEGTKIRIFEVLGPKQYYKKG